MPGYRGRIGEPPAFCNVHVDVQLDDDYQELGGQEVIIYRLAADPAAQIAALEAQLAPLTEALAAAQKHIASLVEQRTRQARLLGNYEEKVAEARVAGREMGLYSAAEWLRENCPGIAADEMVAALSLPDAPAPEPATMDRPEPVPVSVILADREARWAEGFTMGLQAAQRAVTELLPPESACAGTEGAE